MFGKFQNKFVLNLILVFLLTTPIFAKTNSFSINGYDFDQQNINFNKGLRLQGIGDYFFKKKSYAQSVPYYQEALELIPTEADITFKLAEVYQNQKLWRLSILYYRDTIELLKKKVNFNKSQLNSYIANIRIAYIYHLQGDKDQSITLLNSIREESSLLLSLYPEAWEELKKLNDIYPTTAVRKTNL
ncbi:MAG: tetratricopeptide repeat protein [Spirochaetota bacterium]|nr:tetratricopeptide repeat protein [Spirochaetota bacterium]